MSRPRKTLPILLLILVSLYTLFTMKRNRGSRWSGIYKPGQTLGRRINLGYFCPPMKNMRNLLYVIPFGLIFLTAVIGRGKADETSPKIDVKGYYSPSGSHAYHPDNNPATYDENPKNLPLSTIRTYINVDYDEIQSPTKYKTSPPGACAICKDGEYSFSKHRRGTCSQHGGVAEWLKELP